MNDHKKTPLFAHTSLQSIITEFALPVAACQGDRWKASGTAIIIGPGLAVTAKHVFDDFWGMFEKPRMAPGHNPGDFSMVAGQFLNNGQELAIWNVSKVWTSAATDIAFLHLTPDSKSAAKHYWRSATLEISPPLPGSRVSAFGYHSPIIGVDEADSQKAINWGVCPTTAIGEVIEVHEKQRDSGLLSFPCFRTNARFKGG
jgi:hypothetical protein